MIVLQEFLRSRRKKSLVSLQTPSEGALFFSLDLFGWFHRLTPALLRKTDTNGEVCHGVALRGSLIARGADGHELLLCHWAKKSVEEQMTTEGDAKHPHRRMWLFITAGHISLLLYSVGDDLSSCLENMPPWFMLIFTANFHYDWCLTTATNQQHIQCSLHYPMSANDFHLLHNTQDRFTLQRKMSLFEIFKCKFCLEVKTLKETY